MTTFLLIRHASHDLLGKVLAGRTIDVRLNEKGCSEARHLVERLAHATITCILASPRARARDTAAPLAACLDLPVDVDDGLDEVDLGDWSGRAFTELDRDRDWRVWVAQRSRAPPPNGESIAAVQRRVADTIERLAPAHEGSTVALISHGDVIKAAVARFMGISLDDLERFDIAPASVSVIVAGAGSGQVKLVNDTGKIPPD